jgi:DNA-binding transcriptional MerR regulator
LTLPQGQAAFFAAMTKPTAKSMRLLISDVANRTGLSAKALRLYEKRGLLQPQMRTAAGYRVYGPDELQRLMQILLLKHTGFTLREIGLLLERNTHPTSQLLAERITALEQDLAAKSRRLNVLRLVARRMDSASTLNVDELLESIAMSHELKLDLTESERRALLKRAEQLGHDAIESAQQDWPILIAEVRTAMRAGKPPEDPAVQALGRRWHALIQAFTGGDASVTRKLGEAYQSQPHAMEANGMDQEMFRYMGTAMKAAGLKVFE